MQSWEAWPLKCPSFYQWLAKLASAAASIAAAAPKDESRNHRNLWVGMLLGHTIYKALKYPKEISDMFRITAIKLISFSTLDTLGYTRIYFSIHFCGMPFWGSDHLVKEGFAEGFSKGLRNLLKDLQDPWNIRTGPRKISANLGNPLWQASMAQTLTAVTACHRNWPSTGTRVWKRLFQHTDRLKVILCPDYPSRNKRRP